MKDLTKQNGFPITLDDQTGKIFSSSNEVIVPTEGKRTIEQLRAVVENQDASFSGDFVYLVYRGISSRIDVNKIISLDLRYNIVSMPPGTIEDEYVKTIGHFHSAKKNTAIIYPEIYEVLNGEAIFFIQKMNNNFDTVLENYYIACKTGEKIIIPPGYGHVTANVLSDEILIMANIMTVNNVPNYEPYKKFRGASYKFIKLPENKVKIAKNYRYGDVPEARKLKQKNIGELGIIANIPIYQNLIRNSDHLSFLTSPENFEGQLALKQLYADA